MIYKIDYFIRDAYLITLNQIQNTIIELNTDKNLIN